MRCDVLWQGAPPDVPGPSFSSQVRSFASGASARDGSARAERELPSPPPSSLAPPQLPQARALAEP